MKLFALSGSLRAGSLNTKLIKLAVEEARRQGANVTLHDFHDLLPPHYDGDIESAHGIPPQAQMFISAVEQADAVMIASPEYNRSVAGPLKNALDWVSRAKPYRLKDKPTLLLGASSGIGGAINGMEALRNTLDFQGAVVHPDVFSVPNGRDAFDDRGRFTDSAMDERLTRLLNAFLVSIRSSQPVA